MSKLSMFFEFWQFLRMRKKYWLMPIVLMLLALGALMILTEGSVLAPFIYALFKPGTATSLLMGSSTPDVRPPKERLGIVNRRKIDRGNHCIQMVT